MFPALAIASNGLMVQSQRAAEIASAVAGAGATMPPGAQTAAPGASSVRIGSLPVGDPIESLVSLKEVELAYRMNAAVIATASDMLDTLLYAVRPHGR